MGQTKTKGVVASKAVPLSLWQLITTSSDTTIMKKLIESAGLVHEFNKTNISRTMLLPCDTAFRLYFNETGQYNLTTFANNSGLEDLLLYHLHEGSVIRFDDITPGMTLNMSDGASVFVALDWVEGGALLHDEAGRSITFITNETDLSAGANAIAHVISRVLVPARPSCPDAALAANTQFSMFLQTMQAAGYNKTLASTNANYTFLVPTNEAFQAALAGPLNMTFAALLANRTLISSLVSSHILSSVVTWEELYDSVYNSSALGYFDTCSTCSRIWVDETDYGKLTVFGGGSIMDEKALILEANLIAGDFAIMHEIDAVLLPLKLWNNGDCHYVGQTPANGRS